MIGSSSAITIRSFFFASVPGKVVLLCIYRSRPLLRPISIVILGKEQLCLPEVGVVVGEFEHRAREVREAMRGTGSLDASKRSVAPHHRSETFWDQPA